MQTLTPTSQLSSTSRTTKVSEANMTVMPTQEQHCVRCGRSSVDVEFRSPLALKCIECDERTVEERKDYHRSYHKARGRALKRLLDLHPKQFERLLLEERMKVEEEEMAAAASARKKRSAS